jgi:hypothetical protein
MTQNKDNYDLSGFEINEREVNSYKDLDLRPISFNKSNYNNNNGLSYEDINQLNHNFRNINTNNEQIYENIGECIDCEKMESNEQLIVSDIKRQFNEDNSFHNNYNDSIQMSNNSKQLINKRDDKKCHKLKSINKTNNNKNVFKCVFIGCGQIFFYKNSFIKHKNQHLMRNRNRIEFNESESHWNENKVEVKKLTTDRNDFRSDPNYRGLQSLKGLEQYFDRQLIDGSKQYFCKYVENCNFMTNRSQHMARHLHLGHIKIRKFKCNRIHCNKVFESPVSLRQHELNHFCGFGFGFGKHLNTVCGNQSINRYRKRILGNDNKKLFKCVYNECEFVTKSHVAVKRHIHTHLCPNRINHTFNIKPIQQKFDSNSNTSDVFSKVEPFYGKKIVNNEEVFFCKWENCHKIAKELRSISLHIEFKHFRPNHSNFKYCPQVFNFQELSFDESPKIAKRNVTFNEEMAYEYNDESDDSIEEKPKSKVWMPFKCHFNACSKRFLTLDVMRDHLERHKRHN